jgi:hypothetical protein
MARRSHRLGAKPELNAQVAKKILGWKNVHRDHKSGKPDEVWAKKPDKAGRWRKTQVPNFSGDIGQMPAIENRLQQLGLFELYTKELAKIALAKKLPAEWATPEQRCKAALNVVAKRSKRSK